MNLIELNDKMLINKDKKKVVIPEFGQADVDEFRRLVHSSKSVGNSFDTSDDSTSFFAVYSDVKKCVGKDVAEELFYAAKLGFFYPGIPSRLAYILNRMTREYGVATVNESLSRCVKLLSPYVGDLYESNGVEVSLKDVIENFVGGPIKLLTSSVRKVKATNCYEVYVPNVERVALLPGDIANSLPYAECAKITFDRNQGLVIGDLVLRTMNNRLGITKDDFDLREAM